MAELGNLAAQMQPGSERLSKPKGQGEYLKSGLDPEKRKEICRRFTAFFEEESAYPDEGFRKHLGLTQK